MCNALGIEPVITTTSSSSPHELADLVEYCHGDASSTPMGQRRAADGHTRPYNVTFFELGNEQYNTQFVEQVAAMEARAQSLGLGRTLRYIFPSPGLRDSDIDRAKTLGIDAQMTMDIHVGAGGALDQAASIFAARPDFSQSAINLETNAGTHTHSRALQEAADLNSFFSAPAQSQRRVIARTASFCTERSGHFDAFDQGISFFLPNMTWLQPPGHVHAMIAATRQPEAIAVNVSSRAAADHAALLSVSAQSNADKSTLVVRLVNPLASPIGPKGASELRLSIQLARSSACTRCSAQVLRSDNLKAANPSWEPDAVSPQPLPCALSNDSASVPLLNYSYIVVLFDGCSSRAPGS